MSLRQCFALACVLATSAVATAAPLGSSFTYQGQLQDQGVPASGTYDLQFRLYDALQNGAQVGATVTANDVNVISGLFTVQIDFGFSPFAGEARYLDVAVRIGSSTGAYTPLTPRQQLTANPYALFASNAGAAPWSGITGLPASFADQVDNDTTYTAGSGLTLSGGQFTVDTSVVQSRVGGTCAAGSSIRSINSNGTVVCEPDDNSGGTITGVNAGAGLSGGGGSGSVGLSVNFAGSGSADTAARSDHNHDAVYPTKLKRTVVLSPAGSAAANGTALLAALAAISDSSCTNPYLLKLEPGVYDLGAGHLTMKQCVDIEGSGEQTTVVQGSGGASPNTGTVIGASNSEIRNLTVKSSGGTAAVAIFSDNATLRLTHVTALASGASTQNYGIVYRNTETAELSNVTSEARDGSDARGIFNFNSPVFMTLVRAASVNATTGTGVFNDSSSAVMTDVDAVASGGGDARGVFNTGTAMPLISGGSVFAALGTRNYGIYNNGGGSALVTHVNVTVFGGNECYGLYNNNSSSGSLSGVRLAAFFGGVNYGIYNNGSAGSFIVNVDSSVISAATNTIRNDDEFTVRIGATKLEGGAVTGGGTVTCAGVYDETYIFTAGPVCP